MEKLPLSQTLQPSFHHPQSLILEHLQNGDGVPLDPLHDCLRGTGEEYSKVHLQELSFLPNGPFVNKVPACARVNEDEDPDAKAGDEDKDATANAGHQKTQHEGGEATDPSTVSVDEAPDGDLQIESPTLEDDIEAGPNGEQLEVVVRNHQPVC